MVAVMSFGKGYGLTHCRAFEPIRFACKEWEGAAGWGTTLWKSDTVRFVFGHLNYHYQISFKDKRRGDAYGCVYTQPECAEGLLCPHAHFWVHCIYTRVSHPFPIACF